MRLLLTAVALLSLVSPAYAQLAVPNDAGLTYGHVHLNVTDVELHKQLWVDHFGGVVTQKGPLVAVRLPNFLVPLSSREPTGPSLGSVMDHFGFKVRNMAKFLAKWRAAGRTVDSEFTGTEGLPNAHVDHAGRCAGRAARRPGPLGRGVRLPYPLLHARVRGTARLVCRCVRARDPASRRHRDDHERSGHEHELR